MVELDWRGLILPFAYVLVLLGAFTTFSRIYRKRKLGEFWPLHPPLPLSTLLRVYLGSNSTTDTRDPPAQSANLEPWFGPHLQRNIYLTLLHMNPEDESDAKAPTVPDSVLKAALLRRAIEDLHRLVQVRSAKQACSSLLQRGSVGDDLWKRFQRAEKEMEEELRDVVTEVRKP